MRSLGMRSILLALVTMTVSGCAGYFAYHEGNDRIAKGDIDGGVAKLREATELAPDRIDYRQDYFSQRELLINRLLNEATALVDGERFDPAEERYQKILKMDTNNARANDGLVRLARARRSKATLDAAETSARNGNLDDALAKVKTVLVEEPNQRRASLLYRNYTQAQADASGKEFGVYPKLKASYRKSVSVNLNNATLQQIFDSIKLASGLNFMFDKDVKTDVRMTLSLSNKPVEDIIRLVLASNQLDKRVLDEDTLLIYPNTPQKATDYRELIARTFYLVHASATQTAQMLKNIVKVKDMNIDEKLNAITIRDSTEVVQFAARMIENMDIADPEVMLELEVLEVSTNRLMQLGIQWPTSLSASVEGAAGKAGQLTLDEFRNRNAGLVNLQFNDPLISAQLLDQHGDSEVLANPKIRVRNKETAKILIGQRVPVITTISTANVGTSESISYLDVGLKLEVEPTVSLNDEVSMKLALEVSNIVNTVKLASGAQAYTLGTRNTSTVLRVRDNETQILAGLIQRDQRNANTGIPGLNNLPIIDRLFGQSSNSGTKTEVVLLITPHIVRNIAVPPPTQTQILSGTESGMGAAPIQLGRSTPPTGNAVNSPITPQPPRPNLPTSAPASNPAYATPPQLVPPSPTGASSQNTAPALNAPPIIPTTPGTVPKSGP